MNGPNVMGSAIGIDANQDLSPRRIEELERQRDYLRRELDRPVEPATPTPARVKGQQVRCGVCGHFLGRVGELPIESMLDECPRCKNLITLPARQPSASA